MKWNKIVVNTSNWLLDTLIGLYVLGFIVVLVLFLTFRGGPENYTIELNDSFNSWVAKPHVEAGPGMEGFFEVSEVRPVAHRLNLSFKDNRLLLAYIPIFIYAAVYFYLLILLSNLVRSAKRNDLFSQKNVIRLRIIGLLVISNEFISWGIDHLKKWFFQNYLVSTDLTYVKSIWLGLPNIFSSSIIVGLLILIIAEAFSHGLKLKQEQDLTI